MGSKKSDQTLKLLAIGMAVIIIALLLIITVILLQKGETKTADETKIISPEEASSVEKEATEALQQVKEALTDIQSKLPDID